MSYMEVLPDGGSHEPSSEIQRDVGPGERHLDRVTGAPARREQAVRVAGCGAECVFGVLHAVAVVFVVAAGHGKTAEAEQCSEFVRDRADTERGADQESAGPGGGGGVGAALLGDLSVVEATRTVGRV